MAAGAWLGRLVTESYTHFFRLPKLAYRIQPWVPALAIAFSLASAPGRSDGPQCAERSGVAAGSGNAAAGAAAPIAHLDAESLGSTASIFPQR